MTEGQRAFWVILLILLSIFLGWGLGRVLRELWDGFATKE